MNAQSQLTSQAALDDNTQTHATTAEYVYKITFWEQD